MKEWIKTNRIQLCWVEGSSNIDYIFMRATQTVASSFNTKTFPAFPLLAHSEYPGHRPLLGSCPLGWKVWLQSKAQHDLQIPNRMNPQLMQDRREGRSRWTTLVQKASERVERSSIHSAEQLNFHLMKTMQQIIGVQEVETFALG